MPRRRSSPSARRVACWLRSGSRSSIALWARCSALETAAPRCRARRRSRPGRSRARRAGSAPRAGARAGAGAPRRTRARRSRAAHSAPRAGARRPGSPPCRRAAARARPTPPAARRARRRRRAVVDRQHPLRPALDQPQAAVRRDPVQPAPQRAAPLEAAEPAPAAQQRVLERVLGVVQRAEHPVAVRVQLGAVGRDQVLERALVAASRRLRASGGRGRGRGSLGLRPGGALEIHRSVPRFVTNCALSLRSARGAPVCRPEPPMWAGCGRSSGE